MADPKDYADEAAKHLYMADGNGDVDEDSLAWVTEKMQSDLTICRVLAVHAKVIRTHVSPLLAALTVERDEARAELAKAKALIVEMLDDAGGL